MSRKPTPPDLWRALLGAAEERPDRNLLLAGDEQITPALLVDRATRIARRLEAEGVAPGDTVGLVTSGGLATASCLYGILAAGGTAVPLNPASRPGEIERALGPCRPRAVIHDAAREAAASGVPSRRIAAEDLLGDSAPAGDPPLPPANPDRPALFLFSTGSTGLPKRVARTHAMMCADQEHFLAGVPLHEGDVILGVAPVFHSYGICCALLPAVHGGATARLYDQFQPEVVLADATRDRATALACSPFHYSIMAGMKPRPGVSLSSVKWGLSCGVAAPEPVLAAFRERFGVAIRQLYGTSEAANISVNRLEDPAAAWLSSGNPLPGVVARITGRDGAQAARGESGEIAVRSAAVSSGYEDLPDLTAQTFRDGWFHTGDIGRMDADGNLYITGRIKLLINVGGNKVDPLEVEGVLQDHPAVLEAAVVGVPAAHGLESVKAVVVKSDAVDAESLRSFCAERLTGFKVPRAIEFRDTLPRSPTGKLLRKDLIEEDPR